MSDFKQTIVWLKEGKEVRRKDWGNKELRGYLHDGGHIYFQDKDGAVKSEFLNVIDNIEATDWEIYCKEHEWICYYGGEDCQYVSCSKEHRTICKNCGIKKPDEKPKLICVQCEKDITNCIRDTDKFCTNKCKEEFFIKYYENSHWTKRLIESKVKILLEKLK